GADSASKHRLTKMLTNITRSFFFSSRRRHTRWPRDWSSDVCSSDLPDVLQQQGAEDSTAGGADGGGDIDIATSFPTTPGAVPELTMVSLSAANISSNYSTNLGETFQHNGAVAFIPSDDRQWIEADGPNTIYLFYR